jgi:hypothetical protein
MTGLNGNDDNEKILQLKERHIATVSDRIHYGKDEQADNYRAGEFGSIPSENR